MKNKKIGVISQARMTSTRLPGKVLMQVKGKSLLQYHLKRMLDANLECFVATTTNHTDDPVASLCKELNVSIFRGDESDVLSRYYHAAKQWNLDIVVRVTSDCPLIDGGLIRDSLEKYTQMNDDMLYLSNCHKRTFPRGMDFEIFSFKMLEIAFHQAKSESEREHVTPYIWKNEMGIFRHTDVVDKTDNSKYRLTVDEPSDFEVIKVLIEKYDADHMGCAEIVDILNRNSDIASLNADIEQKRV